LKYSVRYRRQNRGIRSKSQRPGKRGVRERGRSKGGGGEKRGEMTQTMYAHMNKIIF
jgi:hypothetical protein